MDVIIAADPVGNWVETGDLQDPIGIQNGDEFENIMVIGSLASVKGLRTLEACVLAVKFAEHDCQAYNEAMFSSTTKSSVSAGADQTGQTILGYGGKTTNTEKKLMIQAINGAGGSRFIEFHICLAVDQPEILMQIQHAGFDAGFHCYADRTQSAGERLWKKTDIILTATS